MNAERRYYVYIMQSTSRRVLYIGVTSNLEKRVFEHKHHRLPGFSDKYNAERLVYFEQYSDVPTAIERETQLKKWRREKKEWLITLKNPRWLDLARDWWTAYEASPKTQGGSTPRWCATVAMTF